MHWQNAKVDEFLLVIHCWRLMNTRRAHTRPPEAQTETLRELVNSALSANGSSTNSREPWRAAKHRMG